MKRYLAKTIYIVATALAFASCTESYIEPDKGETPLSMAVDNDELILNIRNPSAAAVVLSWTSGTNKGTNCAISYVLQMDVAGNNFADGISEEIGKNVYTRAFSNGELNTILRESFGIADGQAAAMELRIVAHPADKSIEEQVSETVVIHVTTYKPVSSALYVIGDATPGGWSLNEASQMNSISGEAGGFIWTGNLVPGKFKFLTTNTGYLPSYCKDGSSAESKLIYRENNDQPDEQFEIESSGSYRITVNIIDLTISVEMTTGPKYNAIYFVGSFTNWSFVPMRLDPNNSFVFRYGAIMTWNGGGEFKFGTQNNSWEDMYHPTIANAPYTHTGVMQNDEGDNKWALTQAECGRPYKMTLDITEGAEKFSMTTFTPFENLYMVGDATQAGWNIDNAVAMTKVDDYNFTWHGNLTAGSVKITCDRQSDWNGVWFMASTNDEEPTGEEQVMAFVDKIHDAGVRDIDRKWKITQAGIYTITCNQLTETITITKQ